METNLQAKAIRMVNSAHERRHSQSSSVQRPTSHLRTRHLVATSVVVRNKIQVCRMLVALIKNGSHAGEFASYMFGTKRSFGAEKSEVSPGGGGRPALGCADAIVITKRSTLRPSKIVVSAKCAEHKT